VLRLPTSQRSYVMGRGSANVNAHGNGDGMEIGDRNKRGQILILRGRMGMGIGLNVCPRAALYWSETRTDGAQSVRSPMS